LEIIMTKALVSAVFDNQAEAETAVSKLRSAGVKDNSISIIAQEGDERAVTATAKRSPMMWLELP